MANHDAELRLRCPRALCDRLDRLATIYDCSRSEAARIAIADGLQGREPKE